MKVVCGTSVATASQPLNGRRWLGGDVVGDAIHTLHFVRNTRGNPLQDLGWENIPVCQNATSEGEYRVRVMDWQQQIKNQPTNQPS